jgi:hypothetical protein
MPFDPDKLASSIEAALKALPTTSSVATVRSTISTCLGVHTSAANRAAIKAARMTAHPKAKKSAVPATSATPTGACYYLNASGVAACAQVTEDACASTPYFGTWFEGELCMVDFALALQAESLFY